MKVVFRSAEITYLARDFGGAKYDFTLKKLRWIRVASERTMAVMSNDKMVFLMRGLPSCGKSYTARRLAGRSGVSPPGARTPLSAERSS